MVVLNGVGRWRRLPCRSTWPPCYRRVILRWGMRVKYLIGVDLWDRRGGAPDWKKRHASSRVEQPQGPVRPLTLTTITGPWFWKSGMP